MEEIYCVARHSTTLFLFYHLAGAYKLRRCHGMKASWERGRPARTTAGAASATSHLHQPGTAPWLSVALAAAVPAGRVAVCSVARKLSGSQRDRMRAGRPRSQGMLSRRRRGECLAGDLSIGFMQEPALPAGQSERTDLGKDSHCSARSGPIRSTTHFK